MLKVLVAGDFIPHCRTIELVRKKRLKEIFGEFLPLLSETDYNVIDLECPIIMDDKVKGIHKSGPLLKMEPCAAEVLKEAGFNLVTLANNHFYDYGETGVNDTLAVCRRQELATVGGGKSAEEAAAIYYVVVKNKTLAFINCCEHEFSVATEGHGGTNPLDPVGNYYQIQQAKAKADYVIVIVHGGHELYQLPSPRMQQTYRFFADAGADVVINGHPHCYSGYEVYRGTPIFYSLGNFSLDMQNPSKSIWNEGYCVILNLEDSGISFSLYPFIQGYEHPGVRFMNSSEKHEFEKRIEELNYQIADSHLLEEEFRKLISKRGRGMLSYFEPYTNEALRILYYKRCLPSWWGRKRLLTLMNLIRCEAHRDIVLGALKDKNN